MKKDIVDISKKKFYNPTLGELTFEQVLQEMINWMAEKPDIFYDIVVGCDSSSEEEPSFPVAVVILRKGQGGRFFLQKIFYQQRKFYNWKQRILEEVLLSCNLALILKEALQKRIAVFPLKLNYQLRYIHADVGTVGPTRDMIKEITGIIRGNGFEAKIKPEAYVASVVADRYS